MTSSRFISYSPLSSVYDSDKDPEYFPDSSESEYSPDVLSENPLKRNVILQLADDASADSGLVSSFVFREDLNQTLTNSTSSLKKPKRVRERDLCFYCDSMVLNFARHLQRSHSTETAVLEFMSKPPNSKERKDLIAAIRRKGNYILNSSDKCVKPVRKSNLNYSESNHLPCHFCLGFFEKKNSYGDIERYVRKILEKPLFLQVTLKRFC